MRKPKLTVERLRELLIYDRETGLFTRRIGVPGHAAGEAVGSVDGNGYLLTTVDGEYHRLHRLAWLYEHGAWPDALIDHKNRKRTDNRLSNLRLATKVENAQNASHHRDCRSGIKGVWEYKPGRWRAAISLEGHRIHLGVFETSDAAGRAYMAASERMQTHGGNGNV